MEYGITCLSGILPHQSIHSHLNLATPCQGDKTSKLEFQRTAVILEKYIVYWNTTHNIPWTFLYHVILYTGIQYTVFSGAWHYLSVRHSAPPVNPFLSQPGHSLSGIQSYYHCLCSLISTSFGLMRPCLNQLQKEYCVKIKVIALY